MLTEDELEQVTGWNLEQRQAFQEEARALQAAAAAGRHGGNGPEAEPGGDEEEVEADG